MDNCFACPEGGTVCGRKVEMKKEVCYTKTDKKKRIMGETGMKYANPYTPGAGFMPGAYCRSKGIAWKEQKNI